MVAPWYRHPWVWMLLAIPGSSVVMGIVLITLALQSEDGLVADDYYRQGLQINRSLERDRVASAQGIGARITRAGNHLRVHLDLGEASTAYPRAMMLRARHATRSHRDREITLEHEGDGIYGSRDTWPEAGIWNLELSTERWRLLAHHAEGREIRMLARVPSADGARERTITR